MHIHRKFGRRREEYLLKQQGENGKAEVVEVSTRVDTRSEHLIELLVGAMDTLDQFDMKGRYLVMDNAVIYKVTEV
ncbi:hypothetical protein RO3G_02278 [Rhizopus delemar RA 99-880]|uniref:Uncharacterized protein n=1 Tax=Rhizopus delemar (strain RA 99-880 / ATCC MYA-4621 / FGSC 9543 / NRRL 43880) TaxID=246409 RepID=I1BMZ4_RHIO9|nr:hypothetical protein RO3G_02278 [Rhizopus delemar RA 99-880]|eukprot:EIE77574.1 hypothetical protein RO3G_02278 [Rhizopus delemar RA 99-880]